MNARDEATAAIEHARSELAMALTHVVKLPAVEADRLAYATHALSNYLMVVSIIVQVARKRLGDAMDDEVAERLNSLTNATKLMKEMVEQLQGQQQAGRPSVVLTRVDLSMVATALCEAYESMALQKNLRIERDFAAGSIMIGADRVGLGAVLDNVMSNAIKYSAHGGTIRVRVFATPDDGVCAISDAGPGIKEREAARLFTRGGRLSAQPTGGEPSTGYGLAIAKDLVAAMCGEIWFENGRDGGATFFVAIPLHAGEAAAAL